MAGNSSPPTGRVCPSCKSNQVYRSHRKGLLERVLLPLVGRRPYRCHDCGHRFLGSRRAHYRPHRDRR